MSKIKTEIVILPLKIGRVSVGRFISLLLLVAAALLALFAVSVPTLAQTGVGPFALTPAQQTVVNKGTTSPAKCGRE